MSLDIITLPLVDNSDRNKENFKNLNKYLIRFTEH